MLNDYVQATNIDEFLASLSNMSLSAIILMVFLFFLYRLCLKKTFKFLLKQSDKIQLICVLIYLVEPLPFMIQNFLEYARYSDFTS